MKTCVACKRASVDAADEVHWARMTMEIAAPQWTQALVLAGDVCSRTCMSAAMRQWADAVKRAPFPGTAKP